MEKRANSAKRNTATFFMRNGEFQESKIWSQVGKGLCVWLIIKYTGVIIDHEYVFAIIMISLIAPDLLKKLITMMAGRAGYTEHTERTDTSKTVTQTVTPKSEGEER